MQIDKFYYIMVGGAALFCVVVISITVINKRLKNTVQKATLEFERSDSYDWLQRLPVNLSPNELRAIMLVLGVSLSPQEASRDLQVDQATFDQIFLEAMKKVADASLTINE